ncbi:hypothetical protein QAD02_007295 [Eretmocerus hayati]|uniref:Uncharacterized protein n=1 Tax=Eretmocerus hayati TaxID=131215 RepID=A0ACC2N3B2_9HYME|nr:hypothetical protein QAD02_007295 [Eretmocerus hayati]
MDEKRLPKRMYVKLEELTDGNPTNDNLNWDPVAITKALANIEGVFARTSWHEEIASALSCGYCPIYKTIRALPDSPTCEGYIMENHPLSHTRALASCTLAGELFLKFNVKSTSHRIIQTETCFLCNFDAEETFLHIFSGRPAHTSYRTDYIIPVHHTTVDTTVLR